MDVLCRPLDGAAFRRYRRGIGHHPAAQPFQTRLRQQPSGIFRPARLGLAPVPTADSSCRSGAGCAGFPAGGNAVYVPPIQRARCTNDALRAAGLFGGAARHDSAAHSSFGLLCAEKRENTNQNRTDFAGMHTVVQPAASLEFETHRPGVGHRIGRMGERPAVAEYAAHPRALHAPCRLAALSVPHRHCFMRDGGRAVCRTVFLPRGLGQPARLSPCRDFGGIYRFGGAAVFCHAASAGLACARAETRRTEINGESSLHTLILKVSDLNAGCFLDKLAHNWLISTMPIDSTQRNNDEHQPISNQQLCKKTNRPISGRPRNYAAQRHGQRTAKPRTGRHPAHRFPQNGAEDLFPGQI